jgi:hypothetical protein
MQRLTEPDVVPPDGYRYFQPETRVTVRGGDYRDLFVKVKEHRLANSLPLGPLWQDEVEDQLCRSLPPGQCKQTDPNRDRVNVATRVTWSDVERGTGVMVNWALSGMAYVDQALADSRADTCSRCFYNVQIQERCGGCSALVNLVHRAVGGRKTSSDPLLRQCAVCKCSNAVQVHFPIEQLATGVPEQMLVQFPDWCWKKQEIEALELAHGR